MRINWQQTTSARQDSSSKKFLTDGAVVNIMRAPRKAHTLSSEVAYERADLPTVSYVFSPECGWCKKNLRSVAALAAQLQGKYHFLGVSLSADRLSEYVAQTGLNFPVYSEPTPATVMAYKFGGTPQTLVRRQRRPGVAKLVWGLSGRDAQGRGEILSSRATRH